jgi:hypothetical protein
MKLFVCWSGDRGLKFANVCKDWLRKVVGDQLVPALSVDIEKGGLWFDDLTDALREARVGIVCLTPEGVTSPWIHFEAGILAKALEADPAASRQPSSTLRIFPFLFGVDPMSLKGPLAAFQATSVIDKDDTWRLIESILGLMPDDERPDRKEVNGRFKANWKSLQEGLKQIEPAPLTDVVPDFESLFRRKTFDESMYDCLKQGWLERFNGARDTQRTLHAVSGSVRKACRPFVADVFNALIFELDAYAMSMSVLIGRAVFPIDADGRVAFDQRGIADACEGRRKRIKSLVARLVDEREAPVFDEAFAFESAETFAERKRLVHRKTAEIRQDPLHPPFQILTHGDQARTSDWDFDRIMYSLWLETGGEMPEVDQQLAFARTELERCTASTGTPSLMALHYSLKPVRRALQGQPLSASTIHEVRSLVTEIRNFIKEKEADAGGQIGRALAEIERLVPEGSPAITA